MMTKKGVFGKYGYMHIFQSKKGLNKKVASEILSLKLNKIISSDSAQTKYFKCNIIYGPSDYF